MEEEMKELPCALLVKIHAKVRLEVWIAAMAQS